MDHLRMSLLLQTMLILVGRVKGIRCRKLSRILSPWEITKIYKSSRSGHRAQAQKLETDQALRGLQLDLNQNLRTSQRRCLRIARNLSNFTLVSFPTSNFKLPQTEEISKIRQEEVFHRILIQAMEAFLLNKLSPQIGSSVVSRALKVIISLL